MGSVFWLMLVIVIAFTLAGSMIFQFLIPNAKISNLTALEEKCKKIASEGFKIHTSYPDFQPDQLPASDMNRLMYLDEMWIKDCVSALPAESIFNIVQKVEHDFYSGE
jgi:pyruvate-formate lyase